MRKGKRYLAGSSFNDEPARPTQEPILPVGQLRPTTGDVAVARLNLLPSRSLTDKVQRSARERLGYSRADIATMLRTDGVSAALEPWQADTYFRLANRNTTLAEIGKQLGGGEIGAGVLVSGWERDVILKYQLINGRLPAPSAKSEQEPEERDDFDRNLDESDAANAQAFSGNSDGYGVHKESDKVGFDRVDTRRVASSRPAYDEGADHGGVSDMHDSFDEESRA